MFILSLHTLCSWTWTASLSLIHILVHVHQSARTSPHILIIMLCVPFMVYWHKANTLWFLSIMINAVKWKQRKTYQHLEHMLKMAHWKVLQASLPLTDTWLFAVLWSVRWEWGRAESDGRSGTKTTTHFSLAEFWKHLNFLHVLTFHRLLFFFLLFLFSPHSSFPAVLMFNPLTQLRQLCSAA